MDQTLFPGFKPTGSASSSCDESLEDTAAEDFPVEATRGGYAAASYSTRSGSSSGSSSGSYSTRSATRPTTPARTSTTRAVRVARHASSSPSSSSASEAGCGATPRSVRRPGRVEHQSHHDAEAWLIAAALPEGFRTPFDQTAALAEGKGTSACYSRCRSDCAEHHRNSLETEPGYVPGHDTTFGSTTSSSSSRKKDVECEVSFADVLQYAGAASVEVTGGPKLLRHVKVRVAPRGIEPSTAAGTPRRGSRPVPRAAGARFVFPPRASD